MSLWRQGRFRGQPVMVEETPEAELVEVRARNAEAAELVDAALARHRGDRVNADLVDVLLDIRSALAPAPPGSQVPSVRRSAPVLPGRWRP